MEEMALIRKFIEEVTAMQISQTNALRCTESRNPRSDRDIVGSGGSCPSSPRPAGGVGDPHPGLPQRLGIDQGDIIDLEAGGGQRLPRGGQHRLDIVTLADTLRRNAKRPRQCRPPGCADRRRDRRCGTTSARPSSSRWVGQAHDLDPEIEIGNHAADHRQLLIILFAEPGDVGRTWLNSFDTTVATPSKWPGRAAPSSPSLTPATETLVAKPSGYIASTGGIHSRSQPASFSMRVSAVSLRDSATGLRSDRTASG